MIQDHIYLRDLIGSCLPVLKEMVKQNMPLLSSICITFHATIKSGGIPPSVKKDNTGMETANGGQLVEPKLQGSALRAEEEVEQKLPTAEA
ncbi:hypothetical protein IFM89_030677, partial [Coptis chinensis]